MMAIKSSKILIFLLSLLLLWISLINQNVFAEIEPRSDESDSFEEANKLNTNGTSTNNGGGGGGGGRKIFGSTIGFYHAFIASLSVIVVSELGDKTFFIAAIMAMRHSRIIVFGGAILALAIMTVLSAVFGLAATIIPRAYTYYISTALFAIFGLKMLKDGYYMKQSDAQEELEEVQLDLKKRDEEYEQQQSATTSVVLPTDDPESGDSPDETKRKPKIKPNNGYIKSRILMQAFTMTFLAEWGDRSQLTTIILGARESVIGVILGGILGHSLCTGLAVIGGRIIAQRISVRTVTIIGGVVFLLFAVSALFFSPLDDETNVTKTP